MLRINSNGSKWAGEAPDDIETLLRVLGEYVLDRTFERYGNFIYQPDTDGLTRFWGNFLALSHVFSIDTDDPALVDALTRAIRANQKRHDYTSQPDAKDVAEAEAKRWQLERDRQHAKQCDAARRTLGLI